MMRVLCMNYVCLLEKLVLYLFMCVMAAEEQYEDLDNLW